MEIRGQNLSFWLSGFGVVGGVSCDPHGRWIAVGSSQGSVTILDANNLHVIRTLVAHSDPVLAVAISPDGSQLVSGGVDNELRLWDLARGKRLRTMHGHADYVRAVVFSADGHTVVSGSDDKSIKIWSATTGVLQKTFDSDSAVQGLAVSPDGRLVASAHENIQVGLWDTVSGQELKTWGKTEDPNHGFLELKRPGMHLVSWSSGGLAFTPDGHSLAIGGVGTIQLWDLNSMTLSSTLGRRADITSVRFSPRGQYLAASTPSGVALWDLRLGRPRHYLRSSGLAFSPFSSDGSTLAAGYDSGRVQMWNLDTGQIIRRMPSFGGTLAFSHDGALLTAASINGTLKSGRRVREMKSTR